MKGTMKDAVTIIVGAGAVLDFDHNGIFPSVKKYHRRGFEFVYSNSRWRKKTASA